MKRHILIIAAAFAVIATLPLVVRGDGGSPSSTPADPNYAAGKKAVDAKDWAKAIEAFKRAQTSADAYNYLGYAYRNLGNFELAFQNYNRALELDPRHRGAHEYIGEAYLLTNNLAKAQEHLAALDKLCFFPCHEYTELKEKVAEYKSKH